LVVLAAEALALVAAGFLSKEVGENHDVDKKIMGGLGGNCEAKITGKKTERPAY
jgi:hypothetical protein